MNKKLPIAYVISGFIGAGKTTFARKLEKETGANDFLAKPFEMNRLLAMVERYAK